MVFVVVRLDEGGEEMGWECVRLFVMFMFRTLVALVGLIIRVLGDAVYRHVRRSNDLSPKDSIIS